MALVLFDLNGLEQLAASAGDAWFVAAHDWDLVGAAGAGLRTVFVARGGPEPVTIRPDRRARALTALEL